MSEITDQAGNALSLTLYKYDACPFCERVQRVVSELGLPVQMRDTLMEPDARQDAIRLGGRTQVPLLMVNDAPLYESADIIRFLTKEVVRVPESASRSGHLRDQPSPETDPESPPST